MNTVKYRELIDAINIVYGFRKEPHTQISMALQLYKDRGEFDGTVLSAIECLQQAEYEIDQSVLHQLSI